MSDNSTLGKILQSSTATDALYRQLSGISPRPIMLDGVEVKIRTKQFKPNHANTFAGRLRRVLTGE